MTTHHPITVRPVDPDPAADGVQPKGCSMPGCRTSGEFAVDLRQVSADLRRHVPNPAAARPRVTIFEVEYACRAHVGDMAGNAVKRYNA